MRGKKVLFWKGTDILYCLIYRRKCGLLYQFVIGTDRYNELTCAGETVAIFPKRKLRKILRRVAEREEARKKEDGYTAQYTFIDEIPKKGE